MERHTGTRRHATSCDYTIAQRIIRSYDAAKVIPTESMVTKDVERAMMILLKEQGAEALSVFAKISDPKAREAMDKAKLCKAVSAFYKCILTLPKQRAVRVLRYLLNEGS